MSQSIVETMLAVLVVILYRGKDIYLDIDGELNEILNLGEGRMNACQSETKSYRGSYGGGGQVVVAMSDVVQKLRDYGH